MSNVSRSNSKRAFTLVEMLLVIVIIGILAGALVASLGGRSQDARVARAKSDISSGIPLALDLFEQDIGRYPTSEEGLKVLVESPNVSGWKGPYLKTGLKPDPWDKPYIYSVNPDDPRHYKLSSAGPDNRPGTEDDVLP